MKTAYAFALVGVAAAALFYVASRPRQVPTTASNRAAQQRSDAYRARLWGDELAGQPDFWA